jgi:hypothetical protein
MAAGWQKSSLRVKIDKRLKPFLQKNRIYLTCTSIYFLKIIFDWTIKYFHRFHIEIILFKRNIHQVQKLILFFSLLRYRLNQVAIISKPEKLKNNFKAKR